MDGTSPEQHCGFSHARKRVKLEPINALSKRKITSTNNYTPQDFQFLLGSRHIDDEDKLPYIITKIRAHRGLIAADRKLLHSNQTKNLDSIHALEALRLTLLSDPKFNLSYKFETNKPEYNPDIQKEKPENTRLDSPARRRKPENTRLETPARRRKPEETDNRRKSELLAKLSEIYSAELFDANRKRIFFSLNTQLMTKPTNSDTSVPKPFHKAM